MITQEIRSNFLKFYKSKGHTVVPSSPVIPYDDPTLLFANAGMNQFKDLFLGKSKRDYTRATSCQKCIRASDLENVGHTSRHCTFFEMMGNFSFGDYFKKEAIEFAWEATEKVLGYDMSKIYATVFHEDEEAFELWRRFLPKEKIFGMGEKDNFWSMGPTGPCGPCSELLYDRGDNFGSAKNPVEDATGERYIEFWNLVFMQYNRLPSGVLEPLPKKSVDTGAGLERLVALKMGVSNVFDTDIFRELIAAIERLSKRKYEPASDTAPAFRVIADHLRSLAFASADGAVPSNVDRGYLLRKFLRRAVRYGRGLGFEEPFLAKLLPTLIQTMGEHYPELKESEGRTAEILTEEEENFFRILRKGGTLLNQILEKAESENKILSGEGAFKLKDTYGLPLEEILLLAKDQHLTVDLAAFDKLENEAKERSRKAQERGPTLYEESELKDFVEKKGATLFTGYDESKGSSKIIGILKEGHFVQRLESGEKGALILEKSPFYPEKGGQAGDRGKIFGKEATLDVIDTQAPYPGLTLHMGEVKEGGFALNEEVTATIDIIRRKLIENNHTATHLLHLALQKVLGPHVRQAGSLVEPERLRFDFNHHKGLTQEEIRLIEDKVNDMIWQNRAVETYELGFEEVAKRKEIKQFFGEKYGSRVRVVDIEESKELCGGTHTHLTGNIGLTKIVEEKAIAAGVRRITALTGKEAIEAARASEDLIGSVLSLFKVQEGQLIEKTKKFIEERRCVECELKDLQIRLMNDEARRWLCECETIENFSFLVKKVQLEPAALKGLSEFLMQNRVSATLLLSEWEGRCHLFVQMSKELVAKGLSAAVWLGQVAPLVGGKGGGKPEMAQGGGALVDKIDQAMKTGQEWIRTQLKKSS